MPGHPVPVMVHVFVQGFDRTPIRWRESGRFRAGGGRPCGPARFRSPVRSLGATGPSRVGGERADRSRRKSRNGGAASMSPNERLAGRSLRARAQAARAEVACAEVACAEVGSRAGRNGDRGVRPGHGVPTRAGERARVIAGRPRAAGRSRVVVAARAGVRARRREAPPGSSALVRQPERAGLSNGREWLCLGVVGAFVCAVVVVVGVASATVPTSGRCDAGRTSDDRVSADLWLPGSRC